MDIQFLHLRALTCSATKARKIPNKESSNQADQNYHQSSNPLKHAVHQPAESLTRTILEETERC